MHGSASGRTLCRQVVQILRHVKRGTAGFGAQNPLLAFLVEKPVKKSSAVISAAGIKHLETRRFNRGLVVSQDLQRGPFFGAAIEGPGDLAF